MFIISSKCSKAHKTKCMSKNVGLKLKYFRLSAMLFADFDNAHAFMSHNPFKRFHARNVIFF